MKEKKAKYEVGNIVYRLTCTGIEKTRIINVWKHSDGYSYDIVGDGHVPEDYLYLTVRGLVKHLKENIDDVTED